MIAMPNLFIVNGTTCKTGILGSLLTNKHANVLATDPVTQSPRRYSLTASAKCSNVVKDDLVIVNVGVQTTFLSGRKTLPGIYGIMSFQ
jgi:hypothetical protein